MSKAIDDVISKAKELRRQFGENQILYFTHVTPILMNAFRTRQFNRSHGVEVAASILSLIEIVDKKDEPAQEEKVQEIELKEIDKFKNSKFNKR